MYNYYWSHREYELRSPYSWGFTAFNSIVGVTNRNLGMNIVHRIGQGNFYYNVNEFADWDYYAEHIYEF